MPVPTGLSEAPKASLISNPALASWILHPAPHGGPRASPSSWATIVRRDWYLEFWKSLALLQAAPSRPSVCLQDVLLPTPPPATCLDPPSRLDLHLCPPHSLPSPRSPHHPSPTPGSSLLPQLSPIVGLSRLSLLLPDTAMPPGGRPSSSPAGSASKPSLWPPPHLHPTIHLTSPTASPAPSLIFEDTWAPQGAPFVW